MLKGRPRQSRSLLFEILCIVHVKLKVHAEVRGSVSVVWPVFYIEIF